MRSYPARSLVAVLFAAVVSTLPCHAEKLVAALNSASTDYLKRRGANNTKTPETYAFMQGKFFGGIVRDTMLEKTKFIEIARTLAVDLKKSSYLPARKLDQADLLLVVHWGVTTGTSGEREMDVRDQDNRNQLYAEYNNAALNEDAHEWTDTYSGPGRDYYRQTFDFSTLESATNELSSAITGKSTSMMLGFASEIQREDRKAMVTERSKTMISLLETNRYFIVVIAYDCRRLLSEKKLVFLWSSRLSVQSPGVDFRTGFQQMSHAGARSFGTADTELRFVPVKAHEGTVTAGDLIIIGYETPEETAKANAKAQKP